MRTRTGPLLMFALLLAMGLPSNSDAITVYADIEGELKQSAPGKTYVNIAGTYTNGSISYKIDPHTVGAGDAAYARVEATDEVSDTLMPRNVKITALSTFENAHIYFWAVFDAPPDTSGGQNVLWESTANGTFTPCTIGNSIALSGYVQTPVNPSPPDGVTGSWNEIGSQQAKVITSTAPGCGAINLSTSETWTTLTGNRVQKGEFWFKLANGNKINFTNAGGIKEKSSTQAGVPGATSPH